MEEHTDGGKKVNDLRPSGLGGAMTCSRLSRVKLGQRALWDSLQHLFGEDTQQLPANIQSLENRAVVIRPWRKNRQRRLHSCSSPSQVEVCTRS